MLPKLLLSAAAVALVLLIGVAVCRMPAPEGSGIHVGGCSTEKQVAPQAQLAADYYLRFAAPAGKALVFGDAELLRDPGEQGVGWVVQLRAAEGRLSVNIGEMSGNSRTGGTQTLTCDLSEQNIAALHMPDGSVHPQHHLCLRVEVVKPPSWRWQKPRRAVLLQELVIDVHDGAIDFVTPTIPAGFSKLPYQRLISQDMAGLPARFCGSEAEQGLMKMLFLMAAMHDAESTERLLPLVRAKARALIAEHAQKGQDWPACWGRAQESARRVHADILPYLQRVDALDCFSETELADFINSPDFARIFGESWREQ